MNYWPIGKHVNAQEHTDGYKLYIEDCNGVLLVSRKTAHDLVRQGHTVVGLEPKKTRFESVARNPKGEAIIIETHGCYNMRGLDIVDDTGEPLTNTGRWYTLGFKGLGKSRIYKTVNAYAETKWFTDEEVEGLIKDKKIEGVKIKGLGKHIYEPCKREYIGEIQKIPQINL